MSKDTKKTMTPRLRFPEFREAGEWVEVNLFGVRDKKAKWSFTGGPFGSNLKASDYIPKGIRVIQLQNIGDGEFIDEYKVFTSKEKANELLSCNIYPGEIILSKMGDPVGRACIIPNLHERYVMCSDGIRLVVDEEKHDKYFIYSLINTKHFRALIEKTATGSTRKRIGLDELKQLPFLVPNDIDEQQKIAATLTSLDDLIAAQSDRISALQAHKKGLMQRLFPAEGETVPRLRFREFEGDGEWGAKKLGDLIEIKGRIGYRGYTVEDIVKEGEGAIALSPSNINDAGSLSFEKSTYISWFKYEESPEIMLEVGQTILVKTGSSYGKAAFVKELPEKCSINPQLVVLKPIWVNSVFLFLLVSHSSIQKQINETVVGGAIPTLSQDSISKFEVLVPSKEEQQKIAATLTSLDELIMAQSEKLEALKKHKKGLMQGVFPGAGET